MKRVHIIYISAFSQWGGSTISLMRRIENLDSSKFRITVVVPEDGPMIEKYEKVGAKVEIVSMVILLRLESLGKILKYISGFLPSVLRLYRLIKRLKVDLVHSNDSIILVGGIAAKLAGIPSITQIRDDISNPAQIVRLRNFVINYFSDRILAVANPILDNFIDFGGDRSKSQVIHNGVDIKIFRPEGKDLNLKDEFFIPKKSKVVTHIARIDPNKGQDCIIDAATAVLNQVPSTYFLLVGDNNFDKFKWYKKKVIQSINERGLGDKIIFAGKKDNIEKIINISDVVILPSAYEALPGVVCEASACGKPVIASNVGGIPEMVIDGKTGYLIPPHDVQALSSSLVSILTNEECAKKMGLEGRKYMEEKFNIVHLTQKLEIFYKDLLTG